MTGRRSPRIPRWLAFVVAGMSGVMALDYARYVLTVERSSARVVALAFWAANALVWGWLAARASRRRGEDDPR